MTKKEVKEAFENEVRTIAKQIVNADNLGMQVTHEIEGKYAEFQVALNECFDIIAAFADKYKIYID